MSTKLLSLLGVLSLVFIACSGETTGNEKSPASDGGAGSGGSAGGGQSGNAGSAGTGGVSGSGGVGGASGSAGMAGAAGGGCSIDPSCSGKEASFCNGNELRSCEAGANCSIASDCTAFCNGCACHVAPPNNGILRATCDTCQTDTDCPKGTVCGLSPVLPDSKAKGCVMGN